MRNIFTVSLVVIVTVISSFNANAKNSDSAFNLNTIEFSLNIDPPTFDPGVRYFYYPNIQAYYDTKLGMYIVNENGAWITTENINFNSYGYSKNNESFVELIGLDTDKPYALLSEHKSKYPANFSSKRKSSMIATTN